MIAYASIKSSFPIYERQAARGTACLASLLVQRLHGREQDDVADGIRAAEHHAAPVDAEAQAAGGGHAVLQRHDEVLVHHVGLLVAVGALFRLCLEALVLDFIL